MSTQPSKEGREQKLPGALAKYYGAEKSLKTQTRGAILFYNRSNERDRYNEEFLNWSTGLSPTSVGPLTSHLSNLHVRVMYDDALLSFTFGCLCGQAAPHCSQ